MQAQLFRSVSPQAVIARQAAFCARVSAGAKYFIATNKEDPSLKALVLPGENPLDGVTAKAFIRDLGIEYLLTTKGSPVSNLKEFETFFDAVMAKEMGVTSGMRCNELAFLFKYNLCIKSMSKFIETPDFAVTKTMMEVLIARKSQFAVSEYKLDNIEEARFLMVNMRDTIVEAYAALDKTNVKKVLQFPKDLPALDWFDNWNRVRCAVVAMEVIKNAIGSDGLNLAPISNEKVEIVVDVTTGATMMVPSEILVEVAKFDDNQWGVKWTLNGTIFADLTSEQVEEMLVLLRHIPAKLAKWLNLCKLNLKIAVTAVGMIGLKGGVPLNTAIHALIADRINGATETTERNAAFLKLYKELEVIVEKCMAEMYPTQTKRARSVELEDEPRSSRVSSRTDEDRHPPSDCFGSD